MSRPPKPSVEDIKDLYEKCKQIYSPLWSQFDEDDKFYELEFKELLRIPAEFSAPGQDERVVLPTCRDMVDACTDNTNVENARVFVNRKGTSAISEKEAELMRKFYLGFIHRTNVESTISPWRQGAKHYWIHGMAVFRTVFDADLYLDAPTPKKGESDDEFGRRMDDWRDYQKTNYNLPIVLQAVHPRCVMPDPYGQGGKFLFETQQKLVLDVKGKYKGWSNPDGKGATEQVECVSFWTPYWRCELYDGEPVLPRDVMPHNYGFIPYVIIDSGLGNLSWDNDPKRRYVGILRYVKDLAISESGNYSISDIVLRRTAWPWGTIEGENPEAVGEIEQAFGSFTKMPPNTKLVPQTPQVPPQALQDHLSRTNSYISAHAAPNSVRGLSETGVRSAVDRRQILAAASTRYQYANEAFRNGTAKVLANAARILKNVIPGSVRVWTKTPTDDFDELIDPDKMKEPFNCYVEFAPTSEEDEYRRHDDLERLVASRIVTQKWARTQMSNVDPDALELQEEIEKLKNDPGLAQMKSQYLSMIMQQYLGQRQAAQNIQQPPQMTMQPQGMMQPEQAGRRMIPPSPQNPAPGSAGDLQNQMQNVRSQTPMQPYQGAGGGGNRR